jgi:ubiquinone/menaquinone biosynthesis C-methylase UbiE
LAKVVKSSKNDWLFIDMLVLKEIIQNFLLGIPVIKQIAWKWHTTGVNNDPEKVAALWNQILAASPVTGKNVLEIGPGRTDALLFLAQKASAESVFGLDVYAYLDNKTLANKGIGYKIYDGKQMPFENNTFDIVWSNDTFEHLKHPAITVHELSRILKNNGIGIINIDLCDHYSQGKPEKTLFNCLKYPEWLWKIMTSNRSAFVNRLRYSDWMMLFSNAGLEVIQQNTTQSELIRQCFKNNDLPYLKNYSEIDAVTNYLSVIIKK